MTVCWRVSLLLDADSKGFVVRPQLIVGAGLLVPGLGKAVIFKWEKESDCVLCIAFSLKS